MPVGGGHFCKGLRRIAGCLNEALVSLGLSLAWKCPECPLTFPQHHLLIHDLFIFRASVKCKEQ